MKSNLYLIILLCFTILLSCEKKEETPKTSNFNSPKEFIENPDVEKAKNNSGIEIYYGENPPPLAGEYITDGSVTKASPELISLVSTPINSTFCLYNQTISGSISFAETLGSIYVTGIGGYITGDNGKFSIWGESIQTGSEAGLPDECTITVVAIMSGQKISGGDLFTKGLSIITEVKNCEDLNEGLVGLWWMWEADFILHGECSGL